MQNFPLNPVAMALLCLFSGPALAAQTQTAIVPVTSGTSQPGNDNAMASGAAPAASTAPAAPKPQGPVTIDANDIQGNADTKVDATGNVRVHQDDTTITGTRMEYRPDAAELETFDGPVYVEKPGMQVNGSKADLFLDDKSGMVDLPSFFFTDKPGRGDALKMIARDNDHQVFEDARYTSCAPGDDDWFYKAKKIEIDRTTDTGVAHNTSVVFKDHTIFYLPYFEFPLDNKRRSGFLTPSFSTSGTSGFDVRIPYYWNIAPNRDATITPQLLAKRGFDLGTDYRYLEKNYTGKIDVNVLPDDALAHRNRWDINLTHNQNFEFLSGLSGAINYQRVSDNNYFRDLSSQLYNTSLTELPQNASLSYSYKDWSASASITNFQTLQDPLAPITPPYNRRELMLSGTQPANYGTELGLYSAVDQFVQTSQVSGVRTVIYPSISLPMTNNWGYITPKIGYNYTAYSLDQTTVVKPDGTRYPNATRALPIMSVDSGVKFERDTSFHGHSYIQTLEPRVYYLNIPYRDQSQFPVFDSAESDFNFPQMFTENRFSGWDRINDANQVTTAVTSRLIDPTTGVEVLHGAIGQRYEFRKPQVTLNSPIEDSRSSNLLANLGGRLTDRWSMDTFFQYDTSNSYTKRFNNWFTYEPNKGQILNLGYRYTRGDIDQIDISTQWPINHRYNLLGRFNYELHDKKFLEGLIGMEYNGGCWKLRTVWHHLVTGAATSTNAIFFQLELGDLSHLGSNPFAILKQDIKGYSRQSANFQEPSNSESN